MAADNLRRHLSGLAPNLDRHHRFLAPINLNFNPVRILWLGLPLRGSLTVGECMVSHAAN